MARAFPDEGKRVREWKKMAESAKIPIVEDPDVVAERKRRMLAAVEAEFGDEFDD